MRSDRTAGRRVRESPEGLPGTHVAGIRYGVLDQLIGYPVRRAQLLVYDDFIRSLAEWGMTPSRFSALVIIANNPGLKLTELAAILAIARSGSVLLINTLEGASLVERRASPTDKRAWGLYLTANGSKILGQVTAAVAEHDARLSSVLSAQERATLMTLLRKLARIDITPPAAGNQQE